ncbi:Alpha-amylase 2 [Lacunisphaera limnophila]|uniref:Alpha-amylase 2 n=1 Tax=Lacunisphaera limnophila TaxID=1838286 RepID=A0A1D8AT77_9BACT|nr:alpha-amylase family glycosyl hydrolase [Lacunisphaera limnophila]AOS44046.1 Alpha-amylase 2 [Lacunisphaera limnophila]
MKKQIALLLSLLLAPLVSAAPAPEREKAQPSAHHVAIGLPDWARGSTIYEINVRQFSATGKFSAVTADLPRLKALGVDVLWLMPIHPIGEVNRKGPLGSYYAAQDYLGVNPEFGTEQDLRDLVNAAHAQGQRVILDWVPNHVSPDNPLTKTHPEFFWRDEQGNLTPPHGTDWTDVVQFDFRVPALLDYQADVLLHWVKNFGIDGFRCDVAWGLPTPFWNEVVRRVRAVKPDALFLAEAELPQQQVAAFNLSYGFDLHHAMNQIAQCKRSASALDEAYAKIHAHFPRGAALMVFTSSHDENSWAGTEFERMGAGYAPFAVLTFLLDGVPMIYNGQEAGLDRRLEFFQRDPIVWPAETHPTTRLYQVMTKLRREHPALHTGSPMRRLDTTDNATFYALERTAADGRRVVGLFNLTAKDAKADLFDPALAGEWRDAFTGETVKLDALVPLDLKAWRYRVLVK